jgi:chromosome segregation ATPase
VECDRALRDSKTKLEQLEKVQQLQQNERNAFEAAIRDVSEKLNAAVVSKEEEIGRRNEVQEVNKDYRNSIDKLRTTIDTLKAQHAQAEHLKESELVSLRATLRDVQRDLADRNRQVARLQREVDESKENMTQQIAHTERKYMEENSMLR